MGNFIFGNTRNPDEAEEDVIGLSDENINRGELLTELRVYYQDYAAIPVKKRKRAKEVVENVKAALQKFIQSDQQASSLFNNLIPHGSIYEGLKVTEADEFDILLPLALFESEWNYEKRFSRCQAPGYFFIKKTRGFMMDIFFSKFNTKFDNAVVSSNYGDYRYLSSAVFKRIILSVIQRAIQNNVFQNGSVTLHKRNTEITLEVRYDNSLRMNIDIVPSIKLGSKWFVAKRHPEADQESYDEQNLYNHIWRESFFEKEKSIVRNMDKKNECRRACLKILKTVRVRNASSPLAMLSSYHLKTCMLHLNESSQNIDPNMLFWHQDNLGSRFKDLMRKLVKFLEDKKMPCFFDPSVDLFRNYDKRQLENIRVWLVQTSCSDDEIISGILSHKPIGKIDVLEPLYQPPSNGGTCSLM